MQLFGIVVLLALLLVPSAEATVYMWNDAEGDLVLTNDPRQVPEDPQHPVRTFETVDGAAAAEARASAATAPGAAPQRAASGQPGTHGAQAAAKEQGDPQGQPSVSGAVAAAGTSGAATRGGARVLGQSETSGASERILGARSGEAAGPLAGADGDGAADDQGSTQQRATIDPRALFEEAAQREPPRVVVSIVPPTERAGSSFDRRGARSRDLEGGGSSLGRDDRIGGFGGGGLGGNDLGRGGGFGGAMSQRRGTFGRGARGLGGR